MDDANVIYGLFSEPLAAERGMENLRAAGVDPGKLVVMSSEPFEEYSFSHDHGSLMPWIALLGGVIGGTGGIFFVWYAQTSYPIVTANMPIFTLWPVVIIGYELTMLGAILASVITLLATAQLPDFRSRFYDPEVSNGKILIGVLDPSASARTDLEKRLRSAGALQIKATGRFA
jgi:hypothetical protein